MPVEQADSNRPEVDETYAAARAAYDEVSKGPAAITVDEPIELKGDETAEQAVERVRDEKGRFAAKEKAEEKAEPEFKEPVKEITAEIKPQAVSTTVENNSQVEIQAQPSAPPPGWSVKSKSEWDKLPEAIRADIVKREQEVNDGFKQYEGMRELRPYMDMARQSGTSLKAALDNYTGIENLLRQDPIRGLRQVVANMGIDPQYLAQAFAPQPTQPGSVDPSGAQPFDPSILHQHINPLAQELQQIKHQLSQQQQAEQRRQEGVINSVLERFKSDPAHRYFENVEDRMTQLFGSGAIQRTGDYAADLATAYETACYENREIRGLLINEQIAKGEAARRAKEKDAAEKARQASRSITGSPSDAVRETADTKRGSSHDDARLAYQEVMGRV